MKTLHLVLNPVPGHARFPFGDPHQQESQEAQKHVRLNPFILPVIDGSQIQRRFEGPESPIDFHQLFVPQSDIPGAQSVIAAGDDVLTVIFQIQQIRNRPEYLLMDRLPVLPKDIQGVGSTEGIKDIGFRLPGPVGGVRLTLRFKLGEMTVDEERPKMLPTIA